MRYVILFAIAAAGLLPLSCRKKQYLPALKDAIITGYDYRKCMCCGGLMLTFTEDPAPYSSPFRLISNAPAYFGFDDSTRFPVYMKVLVTEDTTRCPGSYVLVKRFVLK